MSRIGAELYDHDGYPSLAEIVGTITPPMFLALRVCECGRVGEYAHTRCGRDATLTSFTMRSSPARPATP